MHIEAVTSGIPALLQLFADADQEMSLLYPDARGHPLPVEALLNERSIVLGAWDAGGLIGCGAARRLSVEGESLGEIKRVFVSKPYRRLGVAKAVLLALEGWVAGPGCDVVKLVTGTRQPEAIDLYQGLGSVECGAYGGYTADSLSVFMQKRLRT